MLRYPWILPVMVFVCVIGTFLISYGIAVANNDVDTLFPYISDTGAIPPEHCMFGMLLNFCSLLMAATVYIRHVQIKEYYRQVMRVRNRWANVISFLSLIIGLAACLGVAFVANFSEKEDLQMHLFGASLAFYVGMVYAWTQMIFSYCMKPILAPRWISHIRLLLCLIGTGLLASMMTVGFYSKPHNDTSSELPYRFKSSDPNFGTHLVSTFSEWFMSICFMLFFLTFSAELSHAVIISPRLILDAESENSKSQQQQSSNQTFGYGAHPMGYDEDSTLNYGIHSNLTPSYNPNLYPNAN